ncbi:hypothetical protein [Planobispora rosea]|uniref:hypothetical protein n=1 Tax=Planobispora rosea TaxID=35762 RepID=UPI00083B3D38|nr:hypothetical protein [Planobispora rosea]
MNDERDSAETPSPQPETESGRSPREDGDPPATAPEAALGESRTVAARSGADTGFPDRPLPADPVDPSPPEGDAEAAGDGTATPEPEMGPSS